MTPQDALSRIIEHREIFHDEMVDLMHQIMRGDVSPALIAGILIGLRVKKETIGEIAAAASVMRELSTKVPSDPALPLVDTCGTGGDGAHTFNISTGAMFVAAAAGAKVAKHGGRSVSSQSGSADVLEALGANINLSPDQVALCLRKIGVGFMFAPNHHRAMKHAAPVRKELGVRTLFNILGPLTNPAGARRQVMGVFHPDLVGIQIRVLQRLGSERALTVFGQEGLDEISIAGPTTVAELKDGKIRQFEITPEELGVSTHDPRLLQVANAEESRALLLAALEGQHPAGRDILALNAAATLYVSGISLTLTDGVELALQTIAAGAARAKLDTFVSTTNTISSVE